MSRLEIDNLGIPPLAGLCSYEEACRLGYSVERTVELLKRYNYVLTRLNQIAAAHIPAVPEWEVKCALSLHMWLDAEQAGSMRRRVAEMREPPHHLDSCPDPRLEAWLEEVIRAGDTAELLSGLYRVVRPALIEALERHIEEINPLADHPTYRLLKPMIQEQREMAAWGSQALDALTATEKASSQARAWVAHLQAYLSAAGGVAGDDPAREQASELPPGRWKGEHYEMDAVPRRDGRITSSFDQSFSDTASNSLGDDLPADERAFILLHRRLQEMDVPEWMAPIVYKTEGKPWEYTQDMSRQLWDEARHAMMGEVGLYSHGLPFYSYPIALEGSMTLNSEFDALESHILLWEVEQRLMGRKTGKRFELEMAESSGDELLIRYQDFDWADEVLHAQIGRKWLLSAVGDMKGLREQSATLRPRWHEAMRKLKESVEEDNWWPRFMEEARQIEADKSKENHA